MKTWAMHRFGNNFREEPWMAFRPFIFLPFIFREAAGRAVR